MTREEAIRGHRKMWRWLAENSGKSEIDYLREFEPEAVLDSCCYLCEYVDGNCYYCPFEWPRDKCALSNGLYGQWCRAMLYGEYIRAAEIAHQIAELPERRK